MQTLPTGSGGPELTNAGDEVSEEVPAVLQRWDLGWGGVPSSGGLSGRQMGITKSFSTGPFDSSTRATSFSNVLGSYRGWRKMCLTVRCCSVSSDRSLQCLPGKKKVHETWE